MIDRDELIRALVRAVRDGIISEDDALRILHEHDTDHHFFPPLPIPPKEAVRGLSDQEVQAGYGVPRIGTIDGYREAFRRFCRVAAQQVADGMIDLPTWQTAMAGQIAAHLIAAHILGARDDFLAPADRRRMDAAMEHETTYLARFALTIYVRDALHNPMGADAIASRSALYEGTGYAEYWRAKEGKTGFGWVAAYRARDDGRTCGPCHTAEMAGPYLPTEGPYPGTACLGGGRCRCVRELVYDEDAYRRLTGG
jgi:hypothetical protein